MGEDQRMLPGEGRKSEMWHLWIEAAWAAAALHKLIITSLVDHEQTDGILKRSTAVYCSGLRNLD
jgi:hypothetical protein